MALLAALVAVAATLGLGTLPAAAEAPENLPDTVTDHAGVLTEDEVASLEQLFRQTDDESGVQPFITFVPDFDNMDATQWVEQTAQLSNLNDNEALLAIAVDNNTWAVAVTDGAPVSQGEAEGVVNGELADHFRDGDFAAVGEAWAEGLADEAGGAGIGTLVLGVVVIGAIVGFVIWRRRRSKAEADPLKGLPENHPARLPLPELRTEAGSKLLTADDAVRSSASELEFAKLQFGLQRTDEFTAALERAKAAVADAFEARRLLDDDKPETEPEERRLLLRILDRSHEVDTTLEAQREEFERLRDIESRVEEVLAETGQRAEEVRALVDNSRINLRALSTRYPATALRSISEDPDHADDLLDSALASIQEGQATAPKNRSAAVVHARVAEAAVQQAAQLAERVSGAGKELESATTNLPKAIASISADIEDADRLAQDNAAVAAARKDAVAAIEAGEQARTGGDPLAALDQLENAENAIDEILAPYREREENTRRKRTMAEQKIARADALAESVDRLISTRRGAVGERARTAYSSGVRALNEAKRLLEPSPEEAHRSAQSAESQFRTAEQAVQGDLDSCGGNPYGGGYGRGGYGRRGGGLDVGSMIVGGIISGLLSGGGGHRGGGGFGGGGFGGGFGGGGGGGFGGSSGSGRF
jgi:hypothetical protein